MENQIKDLLVIDQLRKSIVIFKNFLKNFQSQNLKMCIANKPHILSFFEATLLIIYATNLLFSRISF